MRFIFMDEAGTSQKEPVTVVVGLIADADEHVMKAEGLAAEVLRAVPPQFQDDFVFHATDVLQNSKKYDQHWSLTDRLEILREMMSIPRRIGMAVCVSAWWRSAETSKQIENFSSRRVTPAQFDHLIAASLCISVADAGIRKRSRINEVANIVAEDLPEMRKFLKSLPQWFRDTPLHLPPNALRETAKDRAAGFLQQSGNLRVERIRNSIHFVDKAEDPLVQVADACAFGFRRYFAGQTFGESFVKSILGDKFPSVKDFAEPGGCEGYWFTGE